MKKITEAGLKEILKQYQEKEITITIYGVISTTIYIGKLASIIIPNKIELADETGVATAIELEAGMISNILYSKKKSKLKILLENYETVIIDLQ